VVLKSSVQSVENQPKLQRSISPSWDSKNMPYAKLEAIRDLLTNYIFLASWLVCFLTLRIEAACSSETLANIELTTWRYSP
jgi:hypothetical protein